jgi:hypothetical protein
MSEAEPSRDEAEVSRMEAERQDDPLAEEEAEAAAAEAAEIGGPAPDDRVDPAQRPVVEGGEGQAEGFELAEAELIDNAAHGDRKQFPSQDAPPPEEPTNTAFGEPDEPIPQEADQEIRDNE